jgi:hemerythrin-like metal-binding protein
MRESWKEYLPTGSVAVDDDHRRIAEILSEILLAVNTNRPRDVAALLGNLLDSWRSHCEQEERLMFHSGYPQAERHREAHRLFMDDGTRVYREVLRRGLTVGARRWITGRMLAWFRLHISVSDVGLVHFLESRRGATG